MTLSSSPVDRALLPGDLRRCEDVAVGTRFAIQVEWGVFLCPLSEPLSDRPVPLGHL